MAKTKLQRRVKAAQKAVDKFKDKPFSFEERHDCGRMAMFVMKELGVLPPKLRKLSAAEYTSALQVKKAIREAGGDTVNEVMDKFFEAIPAAAALPGDIVSIPSEDDTIGALGVSLGNGVVLSYHEEHNGAVVGNLEASTGAWRTLPL